MSPNVADVPTREPPILVIPVTANVLDDTWFLNVAELVTLTVPPTVKFPDILTFVKLGLALVCTTWEAGRVTNTSLVPALKLILDPVLEDSRVFLVRLLLAEPYVPIPTSHSSNDWWTIA